MSFPPAECSNPFTVDPVPSMAGAFRLLSTLFRYPDEPIYSALGAALCLTDGMAKKLIGHQLVLPSRPELEGGATAIFLAKPDVIPAPLYLSCYLDADGGVGGSVAVEASRIMAAEGLASHSAGNDPNDHLCTLLEFAAVLCERLSDADDARTAERRAGLARLVSGSLRPALARFAPAVALAAPDSFYADAAELCRSFIEEVIPTIKQTMSPQCQE